MPKKRCPNCKALNAESAEYCAMCRELLMGDVQEESDGAPAILTDAGRWVGPNVPAPGPIREARDTTRRRTVRRPAPRVRARRATPRVVYVMGGVALGAVFSAMLIFITGLIDQLAFNGQARSQPALGFELGEVAPLVSSVATAALIGAITGGLVALTDIPWVGLGVFAALFVVLEGWALPGERLGWAYSSLALLGAAAWGAGYGSVIALAVRGVLEEILAQPPR